MELQGTVKKLFDAQTFASGFQKREMVLLTQEQYPQPISIEFLSDKRTMPESIAKRDKLKEKQFDNEFNKMMRESRMNSIDFRSVDRVFMSKCRIIFLLANSINRSVALEPSERKLHNGRKFYMSVY